jgi:CTP:molybdopterin cytidylyltransferase MocA
MVSAILVAAGKSVRMGAGLRRAGEASATQAGTDKLFLEVAGRPVVAHMQRAQAELDHEKSEESHANGV